MSDVKITLPNSDTVWTISNAGPDANGDLTDAYSMRVGIANGAQLMVDAAKELSDFAMDVQWDARALSTAQDLSSEIQGWATTPPSVQDLLKLFETGVIQATPDKVTLHFAAEPLQAWVDVGWTSDRVGELTNGNRTDMEDIKRVPPEYPNWALPDYTDVAAGTAKDPSGVYERPDGTYFYLAYVPATLPAYPQYDPLAKRSWQELDIDWSKTTVVSMPPVADILPTWIQSLSTVKDDLTKTSPFKQTYLQDRSEFLDRLITFVTGLVNTMKKTLEGALKP
ncbi:hypothetical protein [Variovorax soli]|uniref:Uncharacterized protein n=1 Tax=Variovorax soli TaxID=376815 RepID=A0ABU1NF55_9BURK|nr:hypothetical protein [Variovorax soli]MDR6536932.1 hypothetical protein [Variovorax soli]